MKTRLRKKKFKARTRLSGLDIKSIVIVARTCLGKVNTLLGFNALVLYCQSWRKLTAEIMLIARTCLLGEEIKSILSTRWTNFLFITWKTRGGWIFLQKLINRGSPYTRHLTVFNLIIDSLTIQGNNEGNTY